MECESNKKITKEMMDKFNNRNGKPNKWKVGSIKSEYLRSINKNPDVRDKCYDPKLVEEGAAANVSDWNIIKVLLLHSLKLWGIFAVCFLIMLSPLPKTLTDLNNGIVNIILLVISLILCVFILAVPIKSISGFIKTISSSRDSKFKLISMIQILPLILIVLYMLIFYNIMALFAGIGLFLIMGAFGYIFLAWLGWDDILDFI